MQKTVVNKEIKSHFRNYKFIFFIVAFLTLIFCPSTNAAASPKEWKVTQYKGRSQQMFYSIEDENGGLILIDGGSSSASNVKKVKDVIGRHDNHVDAWIITHPHPDHVNAFNQIMGDKNCKVSIGKIYTVKYNYSRYKETAQAFDKFESCEKFDSIIGKMNNVKYVKAGSSFKVNGLKFKVFNAWDSDTDKFSVNLCNLGSMMFKVSGKKTSMLFCADVQSEVEDKILKKYGKSLHADYVQCGHHGNWGLTTKFYDAVGAKTAFMDAPDSIVKAKKNGYDGYLLLQYFNRKGTKVYRFKNAPNTVTLK